MWYCEQLPDVQITARSFHKQHRTYRIVSVMETESVVQRSCSVFEPLTTVPLLNSCDYSELGSTMSQHLGSSSFEQRLLKLQQQQQLLAHSANDFDVHRVAVHDAMDMDDVLANYSK